MGCCFPCCRPGPPHGGPGMGGPGYGRGPGMGGPGMGYGPGYGRGPGMGYGGRYWENWELFLLLFNWLHKKAITIYKIDWLHKIIVNTNCINEILNFLKN